MTYERFRPIEEDDAFSRNDNVPGIEIKMSQGIRDVDILVIRQQVLELYAKCSEILLGHGRSDGLYLLVR
jgi:hypothetical protein